MISRSVLRNVIGLILASIWIPVLASAQTVPDLDNSLKPDAAYVEGGIDKVDLFNGNLILDIPLYSLPQRGAMTLSFSLKFSGKNAWAVGMPPVNPGDPGPVGPNFHWQFTGSGVIPVRDQLIRHFHRNYRATRALPIMTRSKHQTVAFISLDL